MNDIKQGEMRKYDFEGNLINECEYKNGLEHGNEKEYYKSGKLKFEAKYLEGEKIQIKKYYENGNIQLEIKYKKDSDKGKGKEFYENGKIKYEGEYCYESRYGEGKEYNDEGKLIFVGYYKNGERNKMGMLE